MKPAVLIRVVLWWMAILSIAIANGALREKLLIPFIGPQSALIASGLTLSGLIILIAYFALPSLGHLSIGQYWLVGLIWLVMNLIFEFSFGLFFEHKELSELFQPYTFKGGNIWPVVLASTLISPRLAARLRGSI